MLIRRVLFILVEWWVWLYGCPGGFRLLIIVGSDTEVYRVWRREGVVFVLLDFHFEAGIALSWSCVLLAITIIDDSTLCFTFGKHV